jgi:hypothetical protein
MTSEIFSHFYLFYFMSYLESSSLQCRIDLDKKSVRKSAAEAECVACESVPPPSQRVRNRTTLPHQTASFFLPQLAPPSPFHPQGLKSDDERDTVSLPPCQCRQDSPSQERRRGATPRSHRPWERGRASICPRLSGTQLSVEARRRWAASYLT